MDTYCSKCEIPIEPEVDETPSGYILSCPECAGPVGFISYEEADNLEAGPEEMFTEDQRRYLVHLVDKQIEKVDHAICQLYDIKEALGGFDDSED